MLRHVEAGCLLRHTVRSRFLNSVAFLFFEPYFPKCQKILNAVSEIGKAGDRNTVVTHLGCKNFGVVDSYDKVKSFSISTLACSGV